MKKKLFSEIPYIHEGRITLRALTQDDSEALQEFVDNKNVYRYLPTFLFEKKYDDVHYVIDHLYDECFKESIILGVFVDEDFCGLAEFYGYKDDIHKISVGYRSQEKYWGKGIATEVLRLMVKYLYEETDIEIITASVMVENKASSAAAMKNGFDLVIHGADEDWGYDEPVKVDKFIR